VDNNYLVLSTNKSGSGFISTLPTDRLRKVIQSRCAGLDMDGTTGSDACPDWLTCDTDTGRHTWPHGNGISKRKALRAASAGELKHRPVTPTDRASRTKQGQARRSTTSTRVLSAGARGPHGF
jgi:hypothetical protein